MSEFEVQLRDVIIYASHGVLPEEVVTGNQYRVNVRLRFDADSYDSDKDDIDATISYAAVFDVLQIEMNKRASLLETVAVRFAKQVRYRWPQLKNGEIEIIKTVPPIPHMIGQAGVKYYF